MWSDPIVDEVRRIRAEYVESLGHDVKAIFADLREEQEQAKREGWEVVRLPPKRPERTSSAA